MSSIYQYSSYREVLRQTLLAKKQNFGKAFTFEKMAQACRLQRTWLSSVLAGRGHLNADQIFMACRFLEMSQQEIQFTSLLLERERSVFVERRTSIDAQIEEMRQQELSTTSYVRAALLPTDTEPLTDFYLDINAQMIHMFLTIDRYCHDPDAIRRTLKLEREPFQRSLAVVEKAGLIEFKGKTIRVLNDTFHLPTTSRLYPAFRTQMRLKGLEHLGTNDQSKQYSFSVLYSAPEATRQKILARFLEFIEWAKKISQTGEGGEVFQMNFDLLKWS